MAELVNENIQLLPDLMEALEISNDVIRGHGADALEKVARKHPEACTEHLPALLEKVNSDPLPMVRWHLAMIMGHLAIIPGHQEALADTLLALLHDKSSFVQSWAITSLCIIARLYPKQAPKITREISGQSGSPSTAIRTRVRKALTILSNQQAPFPKGWIKSPYIKF